MRATFAVAAGETSGSRWAGPRLRMRGGRVMERLEDIAEAWRSWEAEHDVYQREHHDLV